MHSFIHFFIYLFNPSIRLADAVAFMFHPSSYYYLFDRWLIVCPKLDLCIDAFMRACRQCRAVVLRSMFIDMTSIDHPSVHPSIHPSVRHHTTRINQSIIQLIQPGGASPPHRPYQDHPPTITAPSSPPPKIASLSQYCTW